MINWKVRLKNPIFWVQVGGGVILTALTYNSMQPQDLTTWTGLGNLLKGVCTNPYLLALCAYNTWSAVNDPTTAGVKDSTNALSYTVPKSNASASKEGN